MSVVWLTASPRVAATGAIETVRLAGGGDVAPYYRDGLHYRAGLIRSPRFSASLGFDDNGWTGGTVPQTGNLIFRPGQPDLVDQLAALFWIDAPIVIETGPEGGAVVVALTGTVASAAAVEGALVLEIADLSKAIDKPVATARFAGSGGIEGGIEAAGRVKRRSWGRVFNVEGRIFDKAFNLFEFGDPAFPIQAFDAVRDRGRAADPAPAVLAWQGSIEATIAALRASAPAAGSCVVAPSIAMVKTQAQPAGPLTADLRGEIGAGYVETAPEIAARISAAAGGPALANAGTMASLRAGAAGLHIGDESETTAQALDRLLLGVSLLWVLEPTGSIRLREWSFAAPAGALVARSASRRRTFAPVKARRIGYQRSHRLHNDGEIASILLVGDVAGLAPIATDQGAKVKLDGVAPGATVGGTLGAGGNVKAEDNATLLTDQELRNSRILIAADGTVPAIGTPTRVVANDRVSVVDGAIGGIGVGAGAIVANNRLALGADGYLIYSDAGGAPVNIGQVTIGGLGYSGDLNATFGASWSTNLLGRPAELTDGRVASALDNSGRVKSRILDDAFFGTVGGETTIAMRNRAQHLTVAGRAAEALVSAADGRPFSKIVRTGTANNGEAVSFPTSYGSVPRIAFLPGGKAPTSGANVAIRADALTASGFTMKATEQTVTAGATVTDFGAVAGGVGEPQRVIDRSNGGAPYDGAFRYSVSVSVPQLDPGEPGLLTIGFYARSGGAWVQFATEVYNQTGTYVVPVRAAADFGGGAEFGVSVEFADSGGSITGFNSVSYTLGSVTEASLTSLSPIPFLVMLEQ